MTAHWSDAPPPRLASREARVVTFHSHLQCHWCGGFKLSRTPGYAGERQCLTCGWGGDGESDVPCMFYKIAKS